MNELYVCDPGLAISCPKTGCVHINGGPCYCTTRIEWARTNRRGHPRRNTAMEMLKWEACRTLLKRLRGRAEDDFPCGERHCDKEEP